MCILRVSIRDTTTPQSEHWNVFLRNGGRGGRAAAAAARDDGDLIFDSESESLLSLPLSLVLPLVLPLVLLPPRAKVATPFVCF